MVERHDNTVFLTEEEQTIAGINLSELSVTEAQELAYSLLDRAEIGFSKADEMNRRYYDEAYLADEFTSRYVPVGSYRLQFLGRHILEVCPPEVPEQI